MQIRYIALLVTVLATAPIIIAEAEAYAVDPVLIQTVQGYAAETHYGAEHVDRWNRVLDAFGVISHTSSMTAEQAQQMADKFSAKRWNPIVAALTALEQSQQQQQQQQQDDQQAAVNPQATQYTVDPALIQTVQGYAAETHYGAEHVDRWNRVLDAFGVIQHTSSMTAAQAQEMADKYSAKRWNPIVEALTALEGANSQDQQQSQQQQQQGALENPQYVPQQDQLPSTLQDQQLSPSAEWAIVKAEAQAIHIGTNDLWWEVRIKYGVDSKQLMQFESLEDKYRHSDYWLHTLILNGDTSGPQNLPSHITKLREAIEWVKNEIIAPMNKIIDPYGPVESCPQIDPKTNKALVRYIEAEVVREKTIRGTSADLPDGATLKKATQTHITYTYTDGTLKHDLTERICAYHDLDYGENHRNMVKEAMLALGIDPEADGIEPMSAERAFEIQQRYDNSRYDWPEGDGGWPAWQERIWQDIKTEIRKIEHDRHYEENYDYINDQSTVEEKCAMPSVTCEYTHKPVNTREGSYDYYWVHKMTTTTDGVTTLIQEFYKNGNYKKITAYDENGNIESERTFWEATHQPKLTKTYWPDGTLAYHTEHNNATQITHYTEYYESGNLFANAATFNPDNTANNARIYHDVTPSGSSKMIQYNSQGHYWCWPQHGNNSTPCTPDEISFIKRVFDRLR